MGFSTGRQRSRFILKGEISMPGHSAASVALAAFAATTGVACAQLGLRAPITPLQELAGRIAGAPQRCVVTQQNEPLRLGAERTILYGRGRTIWVNRLGPDCTGIGPNDILIAEPVGASYCRGDRLRSLDPVSRVPGPGCLLGDFVPYRR